jgi:hypothetical protein
LAREKNGVKAKDVRSVKQIKGTKITAPETVMGSSTIEDVAFKDNSFLLNDQIHDKFPGNEIGKK